MSSLSEQDPLSPNDPSSYAPRWLRERAEARLSASHETIPEPVRNPSAPPASLVVQHKNPVSRALNPLAAEVIHEPAELARELDRRAALSSVVVRFVAAACVVTVVALVFFIMLPASRQSDAGSTSSEITGSTKTALPQSGQGDDGLKPALAEFQALLAPAPASQPATHEQSRQLLQQFLQWRQKANSTESSQ